MNLAAGPWSSPPSDRTARSGVVSVLLVPVLQSGQASEGAAAAALDLPGQRVPARAAERLANPLPRSSGFSVFVSDTDQAASGEAV